MTDRRTHSSIERLPAGIRATVDAMIVDGTWPEGMTGEGKPTYEDVVEYCRLQGFGISHSAVGRYAMGIRSLARMKQAGLIAANIMQGLDAENASQAQKAAAEMATAIAIETMSESENMSPRDLQNVARAIKDCTAIAIKADEYVRQQIEDKAKAAEQKVSDIAKKKNLDPETLKMIREEIYGITK